MARQRRYVNREKSGSKSVKNYDPKDTHAGGGGGKPNIAKKYSPPVSTGKKK